MSEHGVNKLGSFLREVSNWDWETFCKAEMNKNFTTNEAIIFALIRACYMRKLTAIQMALNRLDGKIKTPVKIEYPKIYYLFPNATEVLPDEMAVASEPVDEPVDIPAETMEIMAPEQIEEPEAEVVDLPSLSLRETVAKMSDYPRDLPENILAVAEAWEAHIHGRGPKPVEPVAVKSVVAADLLLMAQNRDLNALTEVFDQIDGKLVETIQMLGDDIYIPIYTEFAPHGATKNEEGKYIMEATQSQDTWARRLGADNGQ